MWKSGCARQHQFCANRYAEEQRHDSDEGMHYGAVGVCKRWRAAVHCAVPESAGSALQYIAPEVERLNSGTVFQS
jgi:hypothetical protein